ncbi:HDIG domain-containing protein, partial [bacterium]|nr:HDIG domain-containing protein [bacterium]
LFVILMSGTVSSQNFFFKSLVENGISKKDIIAKKTITVVDTDKTEQRKKEIAQKIEPILTPTEDTFIKDNFTTLINSIVQIKKKEATFETKKDELGILLDISNATRKNFVLDFLLKSDEKMIQQILDKTSLTLTNILSVGVTEKDAENLEKIINRNISSNISKPQATVIRELLMQVVVPNLVVNDYATDIARRNAQALVKPYEVTFEKGDKILFEGEPVTKVKRAALIKAGYNVIDVNYHGFGVVFILVTICTAIFLCYLKIFEKVYYNRDHLVMMGVLSLCMAIISVFIPPAFSSYVLPLLALMMLLTIFSSPRVAFLATSLMLIVISIVMEYNLQFVCTSFLINLVAMEIMAGLKFSKRFDIIKTGLQIGVISAVILLTVNLIEGCLIEVSPELIATDCLFVFLNGVISGIIILGLLPVLESTFKIITPYGLAELADHNQPLLKRLQFEAPGTYHHSLMVSNLCDAAAEAVGANPVLARVGAFYHDIGKLKRPLFFVENQSYFGIENPHTKLNPRLSKMVITAHPKDGVELAKEYGLPAVINNFILQHHGEGLASYFYNQAVFEEGVENVKKEQFRYTGPKPNMKETAILMIADAVESAVRSLKNPTNEEIEAIIDKIITERLNDGQLSDSPLTLKDLRTIAMTFNRILRGMQHNRIKYHEDIVSELDKNKIVPPKVIDTELDDKIKQLENMNKPKDIEDEN